VASPGGSAATAKTPSRRLLAAWELLGLGIAPSTVAGGLQRLVPLFEPLYQAIHERVRQSPYQQADETRWLVFVVQEGKEGYRWWLWVFLGTDAVVYVLDPRRSHDVPEGHFQAGVSVVLLVDRLASYKATTPVKAGLVVLAFCWAHVRRDAVAKSFPEFKPWALRWLRLIRQAYRHNDRRREQLGKAGFAEPDAALRSVMDAMTAQAVEELAATELRQPCRKVLTSLQEHWTGLTRFVDDPHIPMDNNASERRLRGPAVGRKNYYGSAAAWSGQLAAMLFSLLATFQQWQINPRTWLRWYLDACAAAGGQAPESVAAYLPWVNIRFSRSTCRESRRILPVAGCFGLPAPWRAGTMDGQGWLRGVRGNFFFPLQGPILATIRAQVPRQMAFPVGRGLAASRGTRLQVRRPPQTRIDLPQRQRLQQREHHGGQAARPHGTRTVVILASHHRSALRTLRRVIVHRHLRMLDEHR
jgi:hypothetical protein